jgi:hypothetical protein
MSIRNQNNGPNPRMMTSRRTTPCAPLKGFVTEADLPEAEREWPGLQAFFARIPTDERPRTFLELIWRFECRRPAAA